MKDHIKKWIIIIVLAGIGYILAANHVIIYGKNFELLKKTYITFEYTFYMIDNKSPEKILRIDNLRDAGIGDILVEQGRISETRRWDLEQKYDYEAEYE